MLNLSSSSNYLVAFTLILLLFIVAVSFLSIYNKTRTRSYRTYEMHIRDLNEQITNKKRQLEQLAQQKVKQQPLHKQKEIHEQIIDSLDWMLKHNIITPTEYNKLVVKSLPYLN